jgi:hypothetical protein
LRALLKATDLPSLPTTLPATLEEWLPLDHWETGQALDQPLTKPPGEGIVGLLQATWLQVLLCVCAALPLLSPHMPPLTDLGGHLGRFAVQIDGGASAALRQWYSFHWTVIPNLGTDLLMQLLAPHIGLEPALKAIVIAIVVIQAAGFLTLARIVHGQVPPTALLALPLVYGYPFQYGFLNYTLCTALGTWALALWLAMDKPALRLSRWLVFVPIAAALWVCHLEGWALFCILAAGCEFARWRDQELAWTAVLARAAAALSCLLVPCLLFAFWPHAEGARGETGVWFDMIGKLGMVVMAMRDRWGPWDVASALLLLGVIAWTWTARGFSRHAGLSLGALLVGAAFVLLPKHVGGTSFVDMRLVPMILAVALIAVRPREDGPSRVVETLAVVGLVFVGARFAGNAISMAMFDHQFTQDLPVLDAVPRDALLVTLTIKPCVDYDPWLHERRTHLAGYALARRHAFANDQWAMAGGQLLRVHAPAMGRFIGDPSQTGSPGFCRGRPGVTDLVENVPPAVNYLWILENGVAREFGGWHPIRKSPGSVLYTRD